MRKLVNVSDLYVQCMLKVTHLNSPATAASYCCQRPANTAVQMPEGSAWWRCGIHRGVQAVDSDGNVLEYGNVITIIALNESSCERRGI